MKYIYICSIVLLIMSCDKETKSLITIDDKMVNALITIRISNNININTKTNQLIDEFSVNDIWVLQFDGVDDNALLIHKEYLQKPDIRNLNIKLKAGLNQTIFFVCNTGDSDIFNDINATIDSLTIDAFMHLEYSYLKEEDNFSYLSGSYCLRMSGVYKGDITAANCSFNILLNRVSAKINISYKCVPSTNPFEKGSIVRILSVTLKEVPTSSPIISKPDNCDVLVKNTINYEPISPSNLTAGSVIFYMPENIRGSVPTNTLPIHKSLNAPNKATYIEIIGLHYDSIDSNTPNKIVTYKVFLGNNSINDYNINSNTNYNIDLLFNGSSLSDPRISIEKYDVANCYAVLPNFVYKIFLGVKGNGDYNSADANNLVLYNNIKSVGILWQSEEELITLNNFNPNSKILEFEANDYIGGNAVIAGYSGYNCSGSIIWSWHIWVVDYFPNEKVYDISPFNPDYSLNFMPYDLGAIENTSNWGNRGLLYQWGRKDPFPSSSIDTENNEPILYGAVNTITFKNVVYVNNLLNSIEEPTVFYIANPPLKDWYTNMSERSYQNDYLWGSSSPLLIHSKKTIFDPCPAGWRVPFFSNNRSPWSVLNITNSSAIAVGRKWITPYNAKIFSYSGYRSANDGSLNETGEAGYYYSATANSDKSFVFYFNNSLVNSADETKGSRANAFAIRCVRE